MKRIKENNYKYKITNTFEDKLKLKNYVLAQKEQKIIDKIIDDIRSANKIELINFCEDLIDIINNELEWIKKYGGNVSNISVLNEEKNIIRIYNQDSLSDYSFNSGTYFKLEKTQFLEDDFEELYFIVYNEEDLKMYSKYKIVVKPELAAKKIDTIDYLVSENISSSCLVGIINNKIYIANDLVKKQFVKGSDEFFNVIGLYTVSKNKFDYVFDQKIVEVTPNKTIKETIKCNTINEFVDWKKKLDNATNYNYINNCIEVDYEVRLVPPFIPNGYTQKDIVMAENANKTTNKDFNIELDYQKESKNEIINKLSTFYFEHLKENGICNENDKTSFYNEMYNRLNKISNYNFDIPSVNYFNSTELLMMNKLENSILSSYKDYLVWCDINTLKPKVGHLYSNLIHDVLVIKYYDEIEEALVEAKRRGISVMIEVKR